MARVSAATAPLLAEYSARSGRPAVAATEHVLMIAADCEALRAEAPPVSPAPSPQH